MGQQKSGGDPVAAAVPKPVDADGAMGELGAPYGGQGAHNGAIRGASMGPTEGIQRAEQASHAVGGSDLSSAIQSIMASLFGKTAAVPSPNPAPAPPQVGG